MNELLRRRGRAVWSRFVWTYCLSRWACGGSSAVFRVLQGAATHRGRGRGRGRCHRKDILKKSTVKELSSRGNYSLFIMNKMSFFLRDVCLWLFMIESFLDHFPESSQHFRSIHLSIIHPSIHPSITGSSSNQSLRLSVSSGFRSSAVSTWRRPSITAAFISPQPQEKKKKLCERGGSSWQRTSAVEQDVLQTGAEQRVEVAALWPEEGAAETLLLGGVDRGDPGGEEKTCKEREKIGSRVEIWGVQAGNVGFILIC